MLTPSILFENSSLLMKLSWLNNSLPSSFNHPKVSTSLHLYNPIPEYRFIFLFATTLFHQLVTLLKFALDCSKDQ